jgi:carotenoid cleavage dioxygenase
LPHDHHHRPAALRLALVVLAAQDVTAEPIARVHLPTRIPFGFHGSWISDQ